MTKFKLYNLETETAFFVDTMKDQFVGREGSYDQMNSVPTRILKHVRDGKEILYEEHRCRGSITGSHYIVSRTKGIFHNYYDYESELFKKRKDMEKQ